jgi:methionine--tRNA ligase beta chain
MPEDVKEDIDVEFEEVEVEVEASKSDELKEKAEKLKAKAEARNEANKEKLDETLNKSKDVAGKVGENLSKTIDDTIIAMKAMQKNFDSKYQTYRETTATNKINVDLAESADFYYLQAYLAGVEKEEISIDDFDKVQIRVGEVLQCEPVKKAKKLLVSQIRVGSEVRQIVSGIAMHYKPEEMVGKKVAVITNLKPVKLCGIMSEGMNLAAGDDEGNLSVLTVDKDIIAGSEIC